MSGARRPREPRLTSVLRTRSASMHEVVETLRKVVDHDVPILLLGESGSGKDFVAEALHAAGPRHDKAFIRIDCASIPPDLFESELFGYEKGTFTDAVTRKPGRLELAAGGTVYFDEIAALTPALQAKLLRAIEEKSFTRLGGNQPVRFDARVISSSNGEPGGLRRDLLYRINVVTIVLPPLRERTADIAYLARKFLARRKRAISADAMTVLRDYSWPGNIRELRNVIERAVLLEASDTITTAALPSFDAVPLPTATRLLTLEKLEEVYIRQVLHETRNNYSKAAKILGINRKTLLEKRKKYGIG